MIIKTALGIVILIVVAIGAALFLRFQFVQPQPEAVNVEISETNENTVCQSDDDCWCASFTGAKFIPGEKVSHSCNTETSRCYPCVYR